MQSCTLGRPSAASTKVYGYGIAALVVSLAAAACGPKDNPGGPGLVEQGNTTSPTGCGAAQVGYANGAAALIASKCGGCHNSGIAPAMGDYAAAKAAFATGGGLTSVNNGTMPQGSVLAAAEKCVFVNWAAGNYAE